MLFNSPEFALAFLPLSIVLYFWLTSCRCLAAGKAWLVLASLFFYGWWNPHYLPLIMISLLVNYSLGRWLAIAASMPRPIKNGLLGCGVVFNLGLLTYYKYAGFLLGNLALLLGRSVHEISPTLPLAISFFTFTQIAYLVDSYRGQTREYSLLNYALFVTFFPHLIAGPIVHHKHIVPQFSNLRCSLLRYRNIALGLTLFAIGLAKKVLFADTLAQWAVFGFDKSETLTMIEAWATSLSYTFQLYFDFSGYTDMALGAALMFNIRLPVNFNSPYRAPSIRDFWRRWHITLSRFLRDYLYIPLGGNRHSATRTHINLLVTFVLGGLWHGATWMFVIWGALHGLAMIIHRAWRSLGGRMPGWLGWLITFNFINATWVFFRAPNIEAAHKVLKAMVAVDSLAISSERGSLLMVIDKLQQSVAHPLIDATLWPVIFVFAFVIVLWPQNSTSRWLAGGAWETIGYGRAAAYGLLTAIGVIIMLASPYSEFIYFNF